MSLVLPLSSKSTRLPRLITADGTVENPSADLKQWELFQTVEQLHSDISDATTDKKIPPKDPRHVLENIIAARTEIHELSEMLTMVQQQQYLLVEHITAPPQSQPDISKASALRLLTKRLQLSAAASTLKECADQLASKKTKDDIFLNQLKELRGRWKLKQRTTRTATTFYVDLSLPIKGYTLSQDEQVCAEVHIIEDSNGDACILGLNLASSNNNNTEQQDGHGEVDVIIHRGPAALHQALHNQQQLLKWKVVETLINNDAYSSINDDDNNNNDDINSSNSSGERTAAILLTGLQHLAHITVLKRKHIINEYNNKNSSAMDIDGDKEEEQEEDGSSSSYLELVDRKMYGLVREGEVQQAFEREATKHLVVAIETPLSLFSPPKAPNLVKPLRKWLMEMYYR